MNVATVAIVVATLAVNFGWQPSQEDPQAYEVLMQVEPELVDVLAEGEQVPLESHVPASITPIRSIRVVVGTEKLPHTLIARQADAKPQTSERIVRGQELAPLEHTTNFQSDDGWSGGRYTPTTSGDRQYDQRGATIGSTTAQAPPASPWTLDGAQQSATNTVNSHSSSVATGVQRTAQQIDNSGQQMLNSAEEASRNFGSQLQNMAGLSSPSTTTAAPSAAASSARSGWSAPPPLTDPGISPPSTTPVAQSSTVSPWSSILPEQAPPRLTPPPLADGVRIASNPSTSRSAAGPLLPPPPVAGGPAERSVMAGSPPAASRSSEPDWSMGWSGASAANSAQSSDDDFDLVPVQPRPRNASSSATQSADPWNMTHAPATIASGASSSQQPPADDERYPQSATSAPAANGGADVWANFGRPLPADGAGPNTATNAPQTPAPMASAPPAQSPPTQQPAEQPTIATRPGTAQASQQAAGGHEVPWMPLVAVSLALAGSLGANFFLGLSYADARHRYRSLAAKTTRSFEKAAGVAA